MIQIVGEAARRVSEPTRSAAPDISWQAVIAMRHKIVHDYISVDPKVVWDTVLDDLPPLIAALERLIPPEPPSA